MILKILNRLVFKPPFKTIKHRLIPSEYFFKNKKSSKRNFSMENLHPLITIKKLSKVSGIIFLDLLDNPKLYHYKYYPKRKKIKYDLFEEGYPGKLIFQSKDFNSILSLLINLIAEGDL